VLRCGSLAAPLDFASGGPRPACAIVVFVSGCLRLQPRPFAWSEKGRVDEAIRCRQLWPLTMRRTSKTGAFCAPRMRTSRGLSRSLKSLHRTVSTSDVPTVIRRHARVGFHSARCASRSARFLAEHDAGFTAEPEDLCIAAPVRERRTLARERLLSCLEPASRNPQAVSMETISTHTHAYRFAFYPSAPRVRRCYGLPPG